MIGKWPLRCYQGVWLSEHRVPGIIAMQRSFAPRHGDIVLASVPKSGTAWLKALAFATMTRSAYPLDEHPLRRLNSHACVPFLDELFAVVQEAKLNMLPSPRLMNTHLLPTSVADNSNCRIVYICREPKDTMVSLWHFLKRIQPDLSFFELFESVCDGTTVNGAAWDHVLGYWHASKAHPGKVLFLKDEEMLQDPSENTRKLARFLGQPFSDADEEAGAIMRIVELCSLKNLREAEVNRTGYEGVHLKFQYDSHFRKGEMGDWKNHMTPEMARLLDEILVEKFCGSGLTIP